ncbi:MAG: Invasion protein expression up-regulator [Gallionellaceae bacterium]|nr:MAG: Invasion protein expression up-regulator [Gallionellaceae bacterium]
MSYTSIKILHLGSVLLSYSLFFLRGLWVLRASPVMQQRWVKIAPHIIDTVLLGSAITLAVLLGISPFTAPWLAAKIIALLLYIVLGSIALKRGKTRQTKLACWLAAQAVFFYIVLTAWAHDPMPWRAL